MPHPHPSGQLRCGEIHPRHMTWPPLYFGVVDKPIIGIPMSLDTAERWRSGRTYAYIDDAYARAVVGAGGRPIHLPMQEDPGVLLGILDGLLLPGGDDFPPDVPYPDSVKFDLAPEEQIRFDSALLAAALAKEIPILGICYGAQLIALAHGGSLHHHLPVDLPQAANHALPEMTGRHSVHLTADTKLESWLGGDVFEVNSLHHQAVQELGTGLRPCAHSADGLIEGFEGAGFLIGVQWHPEKLDDLSSDRLFHAFVAACKGAVGTDDSSTS